MDLYNRYLMQPSGEQKHQARTPAESAVFALIDNQKREPLLVGWDSMDDAQRNAHMEKLVRIIDPAIIVFRR